MSKKWCRQYGMHCKEDNCEFEHLDQDKIPKLCNSRFDINEGSFVFCELDTNHKEEHTALGWKWS